MCFKSNQERNFAVILLNRETIPNPLTPMDYKNIKISRLDYPISINEKNYCYNSDDDSCRIPNVVIKKWFDNSIEMVYETCHDLLSNNGFTSEYELKIKVVDKLKENRKYNGFVVYWVNSVIEKCRIYIR
jgi:hypothetical protein